MNAFIETLLLTLGIFGPLALFPLCAALGDLMYRNTRIRLVDPADEDRELTGEERSREIYERARAKARQWRVADRHRQRRNLPTLDEELELRRQAWTAARSVHPKAIDPLRGLITADANRLRRNHAA